MVVIFIGHEPIAVESGNNRHLRASSHFEWTKSTNIIESSYVTVSVVCVDVSKCLHPFFVRCQRYWHLTWVLTVLAGFSPVTWHFTGCLMVAWHNTELQLVRRQWWQCTGWHEYRIWYTEQLPDHFTHPTLIPTSVDHMFW